MTVYFGIIGALVLVYVSTFAYRLLRNINAAKCIGLPYLVYPLDQTNILWILTSVPLRPWLKRTLPTRIWNRLTLVIYGWEFYEKRRPFDKYAAAQGDHKSFVIASCGALELWAADPVAAADVLQRPNDFKMPDITGLLFAQFGHNVLTTNGERWAKQRKVVATVINERISKTIFDSTVSQTTGMLDELLLADTGKERASAKSIEMFDMIKRITIHVLSEAGMGAKAPWKSKDGEKPEPGFKMTYIEACKVVMESVTGPIVIPTRILLNWPSWLPGYQKMRQLGVGKREFPMHTKVLLDQERQRARSEKTTTERGNIMSHLLQASAENGNADKSLSEEELNGNLFLFTAAGFETTANTLSYAMMLLARHPKWQDWLFEEVDSLMPADASAAPEYASVFPQVTRIMAVMLETLRLYTPVIHVIRTNEMPQVVKTSKGVIHLPANSTVTIPHIALHLDPEVWPELNRCSDPSWLLSEKQFLPDESTFRPSRWINPVGSARRLYQPPKGYFLPWGHGPRVCPGQKMGQVEFAAVILKLLQRHRLDAVPLAGESLGDVERRLDRLMSGSVPKMTLIMDEIYDADKTGGVPMQLTRRK
ncbi:Cytochrome P450 [Penicillium sp. IBT 31633x]|nr:Cytochrome P450 [Penicillium sp. IBT 31633x]